MTGQDTLSVVGGRLIDPANAIDDHLDLHIAAGRILAVGNAPVATEALPTFIRTPIIEGCVGGSATANVNSARRK